MKTTGPKGLAVIKQFEGLRLHAYPDPGTGGEPYTIGYGHTGGVGAHDVITEAAANDLLAGDLHGAETAVNRLCPVTTQDQFDALISLCYNVGATNLERSLLRKFHNAGAYDKARAEFKKWNRAAGHILLGLTMRRAAEAQIYGAQP